MAWTYFHSQMTDAEAWVALEKFLSDPTVHIPQREMHAIFDLQLAHGPHDLRIAKAIKVMEELSRPAYEHIDAVVASYEAGNKKAFEEAREWFSRQPDMVRVYCWGRALGTGDFSVEKTLERGRAVHEAFGFDMMRAFNQVPGNERWK